MPSQRWASADDAYARLGGDEFACELFDAVAADLAGYGDPELRVAPTQVGWARRRGFAYLWRPARGKSGGRAPLDSA